MRKLSGYAIVSLHSLLWGSRSQVLVSADKYRSAIGSLKLEENGIFVCYG